MKIYTKPPLGLKPRCIHHEQRINEIKEAVVRMFNANHTINVEWIREYNEMINQEPILKEIERGEIEEYADAFIKARKE